MIRRKYMKTLAAVVALTSLVVGIKAITSSSSKSAAGSLEDDFTMFNEDFWKKTDGYSNGSMFNCTWSEKNITFSEDGQMILSLTSPASGEFYGAEYRSLEKYGYGLYEIRMKPAVNPGIVSSFFTYTGPSEGEPWDEIDIEFLGKNTRQVQFNYFTDGVGEHEQVIELDFDAAEEFHWYGFEWKKDAITWYIDGRPVHTATENIPSTPGRIMMNLWNGTGVDSWLEPYDGKAPLHAYYDQFRYTPDKSSDK
ncbi:glycoside hydrolase family 16 protein [Paenibacillus typhae]|uniref:Beta-glucanase n=2 Tax=Paenibacillus typhae TaxID=1174501 RepID=A0A1G8I820_9BACL|nr:Beta-glucanase, GH16 family [Paenibacillus typhae]